MRPRKKDMIPESYICSYVFNRNSSSENDKNFPDKADILFIEKKIPQGGVSCSAADPK
jgi:hypothetical protein